MPAEPAISGSNVDYNARSLDELNRESPLQPVFYSYDGAEVTPDMQATLQKNADILKQYPSWVVTIEGHCDERGTAEYNLTLGDRRAQAARAYLISLGIPAEQDYIAAYCRRTGRDGVPDLPYFQAFSFFRLAAICQGVYARGLAGNASSLDALEVGAKAPRLAEIGWAIARRAMR